MISSRSTGDALQHVNCSIVFNCYAVIVGLLLNVKVTMKNNPHVPPMFNSLFHASFLHSGSLKKQEV